MKKDLEIIRGEIVPKETVKARYESQLKNKLEETMAKPSKDTLVERKIKVAIAQGKFKNLSGHGKPLNLESYVNVPEAFKITYQMLKNAGYVPEEVQLKKEIEEIKEKLKTCTSQEERESLEKDLNEKSTKFGTIMDHYRSLKWFK